MPETCNGNVTPCPHAALSDVSFGFRLLHRRRFSAQQLVDGLGPRNQHIVDPLVGGHGPSDPREPKSKQKLKSATSRNWPKGKQGLKGPALANDEISWHARVFKGLILAANLDLQEVISIVQCLLLSSKASISGCSQRPKIVQQLHRRGQPQNQQFLQTRCLASSSQRAKRQPGVP